MKHNVLIGGGGFIGTNLKNMLPFTEETIIIDRNSEDWQYRDISPEMFGWVGKIDFGDTVHLYALQSQKIPMYGGRLESTEDNLNALLDVVESVKWLREMGTEVKVFYASTSDVYGNAKNGSERRETDVVSLGDPTSPRWSYGACKIVGEHLFMGLMEEYKVPVVIGRIFSSYGPHGNLEEPWKAGAQQIFMYNAIKGIKSKVYGTGKQRRTYIHVEDLTRAMLKLMNEDHTGVFNLCSNMMPISMLELLGWISSVHDSEVAYELVPYDKVHSTKYADVDCKIGCNQKLIAATGWCEDISFLTGLKTTYDWIKKNV